MERLTNGIEYCKLHCDFGKSNECFFSNKDKCYERSIYNRLKEYEDADEQGLLLRLPCKVGDSIYSVIEDGLTIIELKFSLDFYVRRKNDFGKTVFLTQAESEQKLKEMESDSNG